MVIKQQVIAHMGIAHKALHPLGLHEPDSPPRTDARAVALSTVFTPKSTRELTQLGICIAATAATVG